MENKTNHVCKYSGCTLGKNGSHKRYWACPDCDEYSFWRSMGCCFEHFMLYRNEVALERGQELPFPEMVKPTKEVVKVDDSTEPIVLQPSFDSAEKTNKKKTATK